MSWVEQILLGALFGIVPTYLVSRYFFNRATTAALTPYLCFLSKVFPRIDPTVQQNIEIMFRGVPVRNDELFQLQFIVANTGHTSITDPIVPLTLHLPQGIKALDSSILFVSPDGRAVDIEDAAESGTGGGFRFPFRLLNRGDFFLVHLVLAGDLRPRELNFSISAKDLPPTIPWIRLPADSIVNLAEQTRRFNPRSAAIRIAFGVLLTFIGIASWSLIRSAYDGMPSIPDSLGSLLTAFGASLVGLFGLGTTLAGVTLFFSAFFGPVWPGSKPRFGVPAEILRHTLPRFIHESDSVLDEDVFFALRGESP